MVAAAKMRVEVNRLDKGKEFGVGSVQRMLDNESYLQKKKATPTIKKSLLVPLTSDKGLCGGVNSSIVRFC
jgi:F-type H+-transporting ATPase subunit gamma